MPELAKLHAQLLNIVNTIRMIIFFIFAYVMIQKTVTTATLLVAQQHQVLLIVKIGNDRREQNFYTDDYIYVF